MDPAISLPPMLVDPPNTKMARVFEFDPYAGCAPHCPDFEGLIVLPNFLSPYEAKALRVEIDKTPFVPAQSGKMKQHYGPKINFNKRRLNAAAFAGLPAYLGPLESRLRSCFLGFEEISDDAKRQRDRALSGYQTTDVFVLRYHEADCSNLDLHIDDAFAYGEAIIDISLEADSVMTFYDDRHHVDGQHHPRCVRAPLAAGSAALLFGRARFEWQHGILHYDIRSRRTSMTLRTLSDALRATPDGQRVLNYARNKHV